MESANVRITDPGDQAAENATGVQEIPTFPAEPPPSPTLVIDSVGPSVGEDLESALDRQDVAIEEGSVHRSDSSATSDSNNVSIHQQATALTTRTEDDDLQFTAEPTPVIPAPNFHAEPSRVLVNNMDDQFVTTFTLILYFLIASTTLVCYVAVSTALFECLV